MPKIAKAIAAALLLAAVARADEQSFKVYGFMDAEVLKQDYKSDNYLQNLGLVYPNTNAYVDHLNTYFDWKPNQYTRVLAELSLNRIR
jgi:hypothetical protein